MFTRFFFHWSELVTKFSTQFLTQLQLLPTDHRDTAFLVIFTKKCKKWPLDWSQTLPLIKVGYVRTHHLGPFSNITSDYQDKLLADGQRPIFLHSGELKSNQIFFCYDNHTEIQKVVWLCITSFTSVIWL